MTVVTDQGVDKSACRPALADRTASELAARLAGDSFYRIANHILIEADRVLQDLAKIEEGAAADLQDALPAIQAKVDESLRDAVSALNDASCNWRRSWLTNEFADAAYADQGVPTHADDLHLSEAEGLRIRLASGIHLQACVSNCGTEDWRADRDLLCLFITVEEAIALDLTIAHSDDENDLKQLTEAGYHIPQETS